MKEYDKIFKLCFTFFVIAYTFAIIFGNKFKIAEIIMIIVSIGTGIFDISRNHSDSLIKNSTDRVKYTGVIFIVLIAITTYITYDANNPTNFDDKCSVLISGVSSGLFVCASIIFSVHEYNLWIKRKFDKKDNTFDDEIKKLENALENMKNQYNVLEMQNGKYSDKFDKVKKVVNE